MRRCSRCCLHYSIKMVNLVMNLLGIAIIVYSLWLQKIWNIGAAQLPSYPALPKPWFIYTCFGVGIAVCLSTFFSYIVSNWISNSVLCIVSFAIFSKYIDKKHEDFKSFIIFNEEICQLIALFILVPQVGVVALAIVLWSVGIERISESRQLEIPEFTTSFLVGTGSIFLNRTTVTCGRCEVLRTGNPTRQSSFFSYIRTVFRMQFQTRPILS
ncbi:hypothetical protein V6N13_057846 [Hibiscus sabdariffa]|uniref:Uncharacterized protein n=1 Tax=Hibiscus sabdariffa TaxID=183260 RepID=A0ABR2GHX9_9ROSI